MNNEGGGLLNRLWWAYEDKDIFFVYKLGYEWFQVMWVRIPELMWIAWASFLITSFSSSSLVIITNPLLSPNQYHHIMLRLPVYVALALKTLALPSPPSPCSLSVFSSAHPLPLFLFCKHKFHVFKNLLLKSQKIPTGWIFRPDPEQKINQTSRKPSNSQRDFT